MDCLLIKLVGSNPALRGTLFFISIKVLQIILQMTFFKWYIKPFKNLI